jgi:hypothetical protein
VDHPYPELQLGHNERIVKGRPRRRDSKCQLHKDEAAEGIEVGANVDVLCEPSYVN